jgi:hypothetical protein
MSEMKWTSGPWQIGDGFSVDSQYLIIGNMDDEGGSAHVVVADINEDPDEWYANARLIAAAPDLYEAVARMLPYFEGEHAYDHPCSVFARAALAKAVPTLPAQTQASEVSDRE